MPSQTRQFQNPWLRPFRSIAMKIAVFVFVGAVTPALVAEFVLHQHLMEETLARTEDQLKIRASERERLLVRHIEGMQSIAAKLAETTSVREYLSAVERDDAGGLENFGDSAEDIMSVTQRSQWGRTHHIFLTNRDGDVVLSPPKEPTEIPCRLPTVGTEALRNRLGTHLGHNIADHEDFFAALDRPVVSSFYGFVERDHNHQLIMQPVRDAEGRAVGTVVIEVAIDHIDQMLTDGFTLGETGKIFIATRRGRAVSHRVDGFSEALRSQGLAQALASGEIRYGEFEGHEGETVFGIYRPSEIFPWVICVEIDQAEVMAPITAEKQAIALIALATALALGVIGIAVGLYFGMPIRALAKQSARIAEGDLHTPIVTTRDSDEIGDLQQALEAMRGSLYEHIELLDKRVQQRTAELESVNEQMAETQERFTLALAGSQDAIFDWNVRTGGLFLSDRWAELLRERSENLGHDINFLFDRIHADDRAAAYAQLMAFAESGDEHYETEFRISASDGSDVWVLYRAAAVLDAEGRARRISGSVADISGMKQVQTELREIAETDRLTGLANRALLLSRIENAIARSRRSGLLNAILFFDFDRFKVINDSLGHDVGDALLQSISERLRKNVRDTDTAARLGGDEFVILLEDLDTEAQARSVAESLLIACAEPHEVDGHAVVSTASIGLVTNRVGYENPTDMLRDADAAMYQAKARGRGCVVEFDRQMHKAAIDRLAIEEALRKAIEEDEFHLVFQPIVNIENATTVGAEALIRWVSPERGFVSPADFIPIAEEAGLILKIGDWVLENACKTLRGWKDAGILPPGFALNVNVSKRQLLDPDFPDRLRGYLADQNLTFKDLKLEVTETTLVDNRVEVASVLSALREDGAVVAMDDFGTGHSSLSGLHKLPIDDIKIDQSFIRQADMDRKLIAIISSIVSLAEHLNLRIVGEGAETLDHVATLQSLGCQYAQGYYFSKPAKADEFVRLITAGKLPLAA